MNEKQFYHNILLSPGTTSTDGINPGFAQFEVDEETNVPHSLKFTFVDLPLTYNMKSIPEVEDLPLRHVDFDG
jgi:hypothetical protein